MFLTDCQTCGLRELRGARSIELLATTDRGVALFYRCTRCATVNHTGQAPHADVHSAARPLVQPTREGQSRAARVA
jgi:hypothetical protein